MLGFEPCGVKKILGSKRFTKWGRRVFGRKMDFLCFLKLPSGTQLTCIWAHINIYDKLKVGISPINQIRSIVFSELEI